MQIALVSLSFFEVFSLKNNVVDYIVQYLVIRLYDEKPSILQSGNSVQKYKKGIVSLGVLSPSGRLLCRKNKSSCCLLMNTHS